MIIGIDASNVVSGGGLVHIKQILKFNYFKEYGIKKVIIWSSKKTLNEIEDNNYILKKNHFLLNQTPLIRIIWNIIFLNKDLKREKCDLLLVLGGYSVIKFNPIVTISQNMLPFEPKELKNFGLSFKRLKFYLITFLNKKSLKSSDGIIFLSKYAKKRINYSLDLKNINQKVITHGISENFYLKENKIYKSITKHNDITFNIIYVSTIDMYKHQWNVVEAISLLNKEGYNIRLELIGNFYKPALKKLNKSIKNNPNVKDCIIYHGNISHDQLANYYKNKDLIIFASSCENLPIILIEGMATKVPIISSYLGPMKEVLGESAYYFDPYDIMSIYDATKKIIQSTHDREKFASDLRAKSLSYSWKKTSKETFKFLTEVISCNKS